MNTPSSVLLILVDCAGAISCGSVRAKILGGIHVRGRGSTVVDLEDCGKCSNDLDPCWGSEVGVIYEPNRPSS